MATPEVIQSVLEMVGRSSLTASAIIREHWSALRRQLSRSEIDELTQEGLRYRVDNVLHVARSSDAHIRVAYDRTAHGSCESSQQQNVLVAVRCCVGHDEVKPLLHFTVEDAQYVASDARAKASGWLAIATFMERIIEALTTHQVGQVKELPEPIQAMLAEKWPR